MRPGRERIQSQRRVGRPLARGRAARAPGWSPGRLRRRARPSRGRARRGARPGSRARSATAVPSRVLPDPLRPSTATTTVVPRAGRALRAAASTTAATWAGSAARRPGAAPTGGRDMAATLVLGRLGACPWRSASSPASTSTPAGSSRASTSRTCATPATPSSSPVATATQGADELTFLDVTASSGDRATMYDVVARTAEEVFIPLTVGGGVRTVDDVDRLLRAGRRQGRGQHRGHRPAGADRRDRRPVRGPGARAVGRRAPPPRRPPGGPTGGFEVTTHGGRTRTGIDAVDWCVRADELGAGEILLNSMDADGTKDGFDLELIRLVRAEVIVPVVASGGAGRARALRAGRAGGRGRRAGGERLPLRRADDRRGQGRPARRRPPRPLTSPPQCRGGIAPVTRDAGADVRRARMPAQETPSSASRSASTSSGAVELDRRDPQPAGGDAGAARPASPVTVTTGDAGPAVIGSRAGCDEPHPDAASAGTSARPTCAAPTGRPGRCARAPRAAARRRRRRAGRPRGGRRARWC